MQQARAVSTDRSGVKETSPAAVHILRIDGWMTRIRRIHEGGSGARRQRSARFPLMTQLAKPSGAEDGVGSPTGCPAENFDTQRIPSLQPLVDEPGAAAVVEARAGERGESHREFAVLV